MNRRITLTATAHPSEDLMMVEICIDGQNVAELVEAQPDYEGQDVVLTKPNGDFVTIMPAGVENEWFKNADSL